MGKSNHAKSLDRILCLDLFMKNHLYCRNIVNLRRHTEQGACDHGYLNTLCTIKLIDNWFGRLCRTWIRCSMITFPTTCLVFCFTVFDRCLFLRVRDRSHPILLTEPTRRTKCSHFCSCYFVLIVSFRFGSLWRCPAVRGATNYELGWVASSHYAL